MQAPIYAIYVVARLVIATIAAGITRVGIIVVATCDPRAAVPPHYFGRLSRKFLAMASRPASTGRDMTAPTIKRNAAK